MRKRIAISVLMAVACVVLAGCAAGGTDGGSSPSVVGTWGSVAHNQPNLVFTADGSVTGSDGCNGISTTYTLDGDTATLKPWLSTQMACVGVDTWLSKAKTVTIEGDGLTVKNSSGEQIGTLDRAQPTG